MNIPIIIISNPTNPVKNTTIKGKIMRTEIVIVLYLILLIMFVNNFPVYMVVRAEMKQADSPENTSMSI